jgi:hypothetical protein
MQFRLSKHQEPQSRFLTMEQITQQARKRLGIIAISLLAG